MCPVTYNFVITNDGDILLHLDAINDTVLGDLAAAAMAAGCDPLAAGASCSFSVDYEIPASAPDPLENTVTVTYKGTLPGDTSTSVSDAASHSVNLFQPAIQFQKTGAERSKAGDTVSYALTLDNKSSADSPDLHCTISDPLIGVNEQVTLASGGKHVINTSYTVQAGDADPLVNTVSVSCQVEGFPNLLHAEASHSVNLFQPAVTVAKDGPTSAEVGETITYNFEITNSGSSDSPDLVLDSVSDTVLGDLTAIAQVAGCTPLVVGDSCQFTVNYTIPSDDPNPLVNVVTVRYHPDSFLNEVQDEAEHSVEIIVMNEGCTPGYWKNHPDAWVGYSPDQTVESVFDVPDALGLDNDTLLTALNYGGGPGQGGAAQILLRAAVASLLNAAHSDVGHPRTETEIIAAVNAALASGNRSTMLALATALDADNNLGCPLNGGSTSPPLSQLQVVYLPMVNR